MFEKFQKANRIELIKAAIQSIDFEDASIPNKELQLYQALLKLTNKTVQLDVISPLAEPFNIDDLTSNNFNIIKNELSFYLQRNDNLYSTLTDLNNTIKVELESTEKALQKASDAIQSLNLITGEDPNKYYWLTENFNDTTFVDFANTTALVDTDYGSVLLAPTRMTSINNYSIRIDHELTQGIPGCNLLVLNINNKTRTPDAEPEPVYEQAETKSLDSLLDSDPTTYFEIERNFIPPVQRIIRQGRAFVSSESSTEFEDIIKLTKDYDWRVIIDWGDGKIERGSDGKGVRIAEMVDLQSTDLSNLAYNDSRCILALELNLDTPTQLTSLRLLPFIRQNEKIKILKIIAEAADGSSFTVSQDTFIDSKIATTRSQQDLFKRTGTQSTGMVIPIPSDRLISKIKFLLASDPAPTKYGFAHPFKEVLLNLRTERSTFGVRSVDKRKRWARRPVTEETIPLVVQQNTPKLFGALVSLSKGALIGNNIFQSIQNIRNQEALRRSNFNANAAIASGVQSFGGQIGGIAGLSQGLGNIINSAKIGGTLGQVGGFLSKAAPYLQAFSLVNDLVGGLFNTKKTTKIEKEITGFDIFNGQRAAIGLRSIDLLQAEFKGPAVYQTIKRSFPGPVKQVAVFAEEEVPSHWPPGTYFKYEVSIDGSTWLQVNKLDSRDISNFLVLPKPSADLFIRATLSEYPNDLSSSTRLMHLTILGVPV